MSTKNAPRLLTFVSMPFLIFEKDMSKETPPGSLRFVSMPFLIFQKGMGKKILRFLSMLLY